MDADDLNRLSRIQTLWSQLFEAHQGAQDDAEAARQQLLLRYHGAVYRYLRATLRKTLGSSPISAEDLADDLTQEFAVRFMRGDFKKADPERGRFRDFVKTVLRNLVTDYWRNRQKKLVALAEDHLDEVGIWSTTLDDFDKEYLAHWREELFHQTWAALDAFQKDTGQPYYVVLRCKAEQPQMRSQQMAALLGPQLGKTFTEEAIRQTLHRARNKFAELLLEEVAQSLQTHDRARLEQELIELDLLGYCKGALDRHGGG